MTVHATWFGPAEAPLLGFLHMPEGAQARGGVVLCPPLGKEQVVSYRGMVLAAQQLCAAGLVVLRFDYAGTGDSTGTALAPDAVDRWVSSIATAVELMRSTGVRHVSLVGLRMGALLAAASIARCGPLTSMVLWDPVINGRSYLRQQTTLYRVSIGVDRETDGVVSIPSAVLAAEAAAALAALRLASFGADTARQRLLLAMRPSQQNDTVLQALIDASGAERMTLDRQEEFLEPATSQVRIPSRSITEISAWLAGTFPPQRTAAVVPPLRISATVGQAADGSPIIETLQRRGPHGLFTVVTAADSPTHAVVLHSPGTSHRVGAARMYVELARTLAAGSAEVIRFDRRGTGESGVVQHDEVTPMYSAESVVDARNILTSVRAAPQNTTLAGVCAGGWMAMSAALTPGAGAVVLLSPIIWALQTRECKAAAAGIPVDASGLDNVRRSRRLQVKHILRRYLPYPLWRGLGCIGVTQVPEVALSALLRRGVDVTVVLTPPDHTWFVGQRGLEGLRRLHRKGLRPQLVIGEQGDHSLMHRAMRERAMAEVLRAVGHRSADRDAVTVHPVVLGQYAELHEPGRAQ